MSKDNKGLFTVIKLKFTWSIVIALSIVMTFIVGTFIVFCDSTSKENARLFIQKVIDCNGVFDEEFVVMSNLNRANLYTSSYTSMLVDKKTGQVNSVIKYFGRDLKRSYSEKDLIKYIYSAKTFKSSGKKSDYMYRIVPYDENLNMIVILDMHEEFKSNRKFAQLSTLIFLVSVFIFYVIAKITGKAAVKPAEEAFENQKRFIADASHELKTPVAVISANLDVLENEIKDNKWVSYIRSENNRMAELVQNLLFLAKTDSGKKNTFFSKFDLKETIALTVLPYQTLLYEEDKKLELDLPKEELFVVADENRLKQLIIIFLDNAIKYSGRGDLVRISCGRVLNKNFIRFYNTGEGISEENQKKIFERFFREDSSRQRHAGGYGLGLSIADSIARSHNGKINVESEAGKYAEFTFTFPRHGLKLDTSFEK